MDSNKLMLNMRKFVFEHRATTTDPDDAARHWVEATILPAHKKRLVNADRISVAANKEYGRIGPMVNHEWAKKFWLRIVFLLEKELPSLAERTLEKSS